MADLRATLITPGVNANAALGAATDAFANLQKQMNAPFERKLEADIRNTARQDKLNEVEYQHKRDSIADQRYLDQIAREEKIRQEGIAKEAAQSAYLQEKVAPGSYGSSVAQKEYDAAFNVSGLTEQEKQDISNALGKNFITDRSSTVSKEAVTNPLVSGSTIFEYDDAEKKRLHEQKVLDETKRSNIAQEKNNAAQVAISARNAALQEKEYRDRIAKEKAFFAGDTADIDVKTDKDGKIIKEKTITLDGNSQDWKNLSPEQKAEIEKRFTDDKELSGLKDAKNSLLEIQKEHGKTTGSINENISENAIKNKFKENKNKSKNEVSSDGGISYTNRENELLGEESKLISEIRNSTNEDVLKEKQLKLDGVRYGILKEQAKYDFNAYKKLDEYERKNIDNLISESQAKIDLKAKNILDQVNSEGKSKETKVEYLSVSPEEAKKNTIYNVKEKLRLSNPEMSEYELNMAASKRGAEVEKNQRELIKNSKENALAALKISENRIENEYNKVSSELESLKKNQIDVSKQYSTYGLNNKQILQRLKEIEEDIADKESRLNLLSIASQPLK